MSTSGTVVFGGARSDVIKDALYTINAIPAGTYDQLVASGDTEIIAHAARVLQRMELDWQNEGINLWKIVRNSQALVSGTASYALPYTVADVLADNIFVRSSSGNDTQARYISRREYSNLTNKTQAGKPNLLYIEKVTANTVGAHTYQGGLVLYPWPVPNDATDVLHFTSLNKIQDLSAESQDPDHPTRWQDALVFGLAYKLTFSYTTPMDRVSLVKSEAEATKARARMDDKERGGTHFRVSPLRGIG